MTEQKAPIPLTGFNQPTSAPLVGERLKNALGMTKAQTPVATKSSDDISTLREKVRDYKGGDGLIARKLESYVSAIAIEKFAYNGGTLSDDEMSAVASIVLPGRSIRNGRFIAEHWSPPVKDADIKVKPLSLKNAKGEGLPRIDELRVSNAEATETHNILVGITEPIQISAIRQGLLQSLLIGGWSSERPEYQQARLDAITAALLENSVIARTDTPADRKGATGQFMIVHRSKLSIVAQWANACF